MVATAIPQIRTLGRLRSLAVDTASTVGSATVEVEITDSLTSRRLAAAVDRRVGARAFKGVGDEWSDVQEAFDYWAERMRARLAELRAEG